MALKKVVVDFRGSETVVDLTAAEEQSRLAEELANEDKVNTTVPFPPLTDQIEAIMIQFKAMGLGGVTITPELQLILDKLQLAKDSQNL